MSPSATTSARASALRPSPTTLHLKKRPAEKAHRNKRNILREKAAFASEIETPPCPSGTWRRFFVFISRFCRRSREGTDAAPRTEGIGLRGASAQPYSHIAACPRFITGEAQALACLSVAGGDKYRG